MSKTVLEELHETNRPLLDVWLLRPGEHGFEEARAILAYWAAVKRLTSIDDEPTAAAVELNAFVEAHQAELAGLGTREELLHYGYPRTWDEEVAALAKRYKEIDPNVPDADALRVLKRLDDASLAAWACLALGVRPKYDGLKEAGLAMFDMTYLFLSAGPQCDRLMLAAAGRVIDKLLARTLTYVRTIASAFLYWSGQLDKEAALKRILETCEDVPEPAAKFLG